MRHLMLDLETFGTRPGCVVLSIGAVEFDMSGRCHKRFHAHMETEPQVAAGLHIDPRTVDWWLDQSKEAQTQLLKSTRLHPTLVLNDLVQAFDWSDLRVWANGAGFDFPILKALFDAYDMQAPWAFYNEMDFRTLKVLIGKERFKLLQVHNDLKHDALADAIAQTGTLMNVINWINGDHNGQRLVA